MSKYPTIHVGQETHDTLKSVSQETGIKIMPLVDRIVAAWHRGEVFFLGPALRSATPQTGKATRRPRAGGAV